MKTIEQKEITLITKYHNRGLYGTEIAKILGIPARKVQRVINVITQPKIAQIVPKRRKAIELIQTGFSYTEVARMLKVSKSSIYIWHKAYKLETAPTIGKTHKLKILPQFFTAVAEGRKMFEIRENDRDYRTNDLIILQEFNPVNNTYTGKEIKVLVTYILDDSNYNKDGYITLSIKPYTSAK